MIREVLLGDICELKYGKSLPASSRVAGSAFVYGSNGPVGTHSEALLEGPAIVVGRKGSYGEVHFSSGPLWPIDTTYYIDRTATDCDLRWLHHLLKFLPLTTLNKSAAIPGLSREDAYRLAVRLPPLPEQRRIAAILDNADALRRKRKRAIDLLDSLTQSIFLEMFGEPINSKNASFKTVEFKSVTNRITYGFTQPMSHHPDGIPILTAKNIRLGSIDYDAIHYTSEEDFASLTEKSRPKTGDILITKDGTIGRAAIFESTERACINQSVCLVQLRNDAVEAKYVLHYLLSPPVQARIDGMKKGNAVPHLQITELATFPIALPPKTQQFEFIKRLACTESLRNSALQSSNKAGALFSSLQNRAFSGQL